MIRQLVIYLCGNLLPMSVSLLSASLFTRIFSTEQYGRLNLVLMFALFSATLSYQWLQQAISRYLPAQQQGDGREGVRLVVAGSLVLIAAAQLLVSLPALSLAPLAGAWGTFALCGVVLVIGTSLLMPLTVIFQAEMNAFAYTGYNALLSVLKLLAGLGCVALMQRRPEGIVLGYGVASLMLLPFLWRHAGLPAPSALLGRDRLLPVAGGVRQYARYGVPMTGWFLASNLLSLSDRYIIQFFRGASEVGIYTANYNLIMGGVGVVAAPVLYALHPYLMRSWDGREREKVALLLGFILETLLVFGALLVGLLALFSADCARLLLGPEFREGHAVMPAILCGLVLWQIGTYTHKPLEFAERTKVMMGLCLVAALVNIACNLALVPRYGYVASAWATIAGYLTYALLSGLVGVRIVRWRVEWLDLAVKLVVPVLGSAALVQARETLLAGLGYGANLAVSALLALLLCGVVLKMALRSYARVRGCCAPGRAVPVGEAA